MVAFLHNRAFNLTDADISLTYASYAEAETNALKWSALYNNNKNASQFDYRYYNQTVINNTLNDVYPGLYERITSKPDRGRDDGTW
jgi:hypothetical protein